MAGGALGALLLWITLCLRAERVFKRISSTGTVVLVQALTLLIQSGLTASMALGGFADDTAGLRQFQLIWLGLRALAILVVVVLSLTTLKEALFKAIVSANVLLTLGLLVSTAGLIYILTGNATGHGAVVLTDVLLTAVANVLIFSIWYWIIDPPGIDETQPSSEPWEFVHLTGCAAH